MDNAKIAIRGEKTIKKGNFAHITALANTIVELCETDAYIYVKVLESSKFTQFMDTLLKETN